MDSQEFYRKVFIASGIPGEYADFKNIDPDNSSFKILEQYLRNVIKQNNDSNKESL